MAPPDTVFDLSAFLAQMHAGHAGLLGVEYRAHGPDWTELALPYQAALIGDPERGVLASGPILALMDTACSIAVFLKLGVERSHATLDLRIDYVRPATPGKTVIGRGECYRTTRAISFVRGIAHDGDSADPIANVAGTFMFTDL